MISFERCEDGQHRISVIDHGHGMSRDTVVNKWMVPSTSDKEDRGGRSPGGRIMQGRKGIGRYAASILGDRSASRNDDSLSGEKTTLYLQWKDFEDAAYLGDVAVLIETTPTDDPAGTMLVIAVDAERLAAWEGSQFAKLQFELRKLMPPFATIVTEQAFEVNLRTKDLPGVVDIDARVEPYPLVEYFDYSIAGKIGADGIGTLLYSQQKSRNTSTEEIPIELGKPTGCGELEIDIRVYDRDSASLDQLIRRGLMDDAGNYLGKLQARQLLNDYKRDRGVSERLPSKATRRSRIRLAQAQRTAHPSASSPDRE